MFNINVTGERFILVKGKLERTPYRRVISAETIQELEQILDEIPEVCTIRESKGIMLAERVASVKIA